MKTTIEPSEDISTLVEKGKELTSSLREKAVAGVKATHKAVKANPYKAIGIAFAVGAIVGLILSRRSSSPKED